MVFKWPENLDLLAKALSLLSWNTAMSRLIQNFTIHGSLKWACSQMNNMMKYPLCFTKCTIHHVHYTVYNTPCTIHHVHSYNPSYSHSELKNGKCDAGIIAADRALKIDPKSTKALYRKGKLLEEKGELEQAELVLKQALKIDPNSVVGAICWVFKVHLCIAFIYYF